mmetsp:Transcript_10783/g.35906  ORF Transcript_10783/g.35906 Transcript_10783/m.35906 type:complete len:255 (+) Transcript_10783:290-1054(+)
MIESSNEVAKATAKRTSNDDMARSADIIFSDGPRASVVCAARARASAIGSATKKKANHAAAAALATGSDPRASAAAHPTTESLRFGSSTNGSIKPSPVRRTMGTHSASGRRTSEFKKTHTRSQFGYAAARALSSPALPAAVASKAARKHVEDAQTSEIKTPAANGATRRSANSAASMRTSNATQKRQAEVFIARWNFDKCPRASKPPAESDRPQTPITASSTNGPAPDAKSKSREKTREPESQKSWIVDHVLNL